MAQPSASEPKPLPKPEVSTIVLKYQERHVLVPRPLSYGDVISFIRRNLLNNEDDNIRILARVPGHPDSVDEEVEITRDAWDMVAPSISTFTVATSNDQRENLGGGGDQPAPQNPAPPMPQGDLYIDLPIGRTVPISIDLMDTIGYLKIKIQQSQNVLPFQQVLHFGDVQLEDGRTCASYGLQKGDRVTLFINRNIRKPVIYLYPPTSIDATVTLSLVPHWRFSILYPPTAEKDVKVGDQVRQQVQWNVVARPDGELTDKDSGIDVAYLFWEAEPCSIFTLPDSPPSSPTATAPAKVVSGEKGDNFIPGLTKCTPKDSVVLPGSQVATYLDKALTELGLHPEARTSFITYWLPYILKHQFIALRFITQSSFEKVAPLNIEPTPDVVTRVFMLFQSIPALEVSGVWKEAQERAQEPVSLWSSVVGTDKGKQMDKSLFRVLEWGGMEVD